ncbi:hypothetical protein BC629DRAFT_1562793 [Irpex lacteus]|nr:hypothetical protein BC629DRAFT_1562793 [Irpex lacteus]
MENMQPPSKEIDLRLAATLNFVRTYCRGVPVPYYGMRWEKQKDGKVKAYAIETPLDRPGWAPLTKVLPGCPRSDDSPWGFVLRHEAFLKIATRLRDIIEELHAAPAPEAFGPDELVRAVDGKPIKVPQRLSPVVKLEDMDMVYTPLMFHYALRLCDLQIGSSSAQTVDHLTISSMPGMTLNHRHHLKVWKPWEFPLCFSHGNLTTDNIIVNANGDILAITGWEYAGWLPAYWDYAVHRIRDCDDIPDFGSTVNVNARYQEPWWTQFWLPYVVPREHRLITLAGTRSKAELEPVFPEPEFDDGYHAALKGQKGFQLAVSQLENTLHSRRHCRGYPEAQYGEDKNVIGKLIWYGKDEPGLRVIAISKDSCVVTYLYISCEPMILRLVIPRLSTCL